MKTELQTVRYNVSGMDCPSCAEKIEGAVKKISGIKAVKVSTTTQILTVEATNPERELPQVRESVEVLGYHLNLIEEGDDDDLPKNLAHTTPAYRKALYIVVFLNVGYGLVEIVGGVLAGSQALKADALDFLGDGVITFLGLLAIGWSLAWRARSALIQGVFLGLLGLGVLGNTVYRFFTQQLPEPELMGILGAIALVVNIVAALVLLPHRKGDANARAVWLFSRNDALGNLAVVIAAGLVAWMESPYPDLVVAVVIAGLFLQSSIIIIRDARNELS